MNKRKYNDLDIVEFDFRPNSLDVNGEQVTLIGVINGILRWRGLNDDHSVGVRYSIQLMDKERNISGDIIVPEEHINRKIE